jgi:hypothetical protein
MLVPAGGLDKNGEWHPSRKKFLIPVEALSVGFRGRFMKLAKEALPGIPFPAEVWKKKWVVFCRPTFRKEKQVLRYLGRYVHRIAISNNRIESCQDGLVTFRYQNSETHQWKRMSLPAREFLRRNLQHVLPQRFHKVRYYGLLSPANRHILKRLQLLLADRRKLVQEATTEGAPAQVGSAKVCPCCSQGIMVMISWLPRRARSPPSGRTIQSPQAM